MNANQQNTLDVYVTISKKKNRQHNGLKKKCKRTNDRQNIHIKLKIE